MRAARSYAVTKRSPFSCREIFAEQHSKISERAPRSGNAATLRTHQVESRHAGFATPGAFRHRMHAHERRARARLCQLIRRLASPLRMKRSGAELPRCTWSGCGGRLNGVAVADVKRYRRGGAPYRALSRCATLVVAAMLSRPLGAAQSAQLRGASLRAAECAYVCHLAVWWSVAARNARRRPKKAKKAMEAQ